MMNAVLAKLKLLLRPHPGWYALLAAVGLALMGTAAIGTVSEHFASLQTRRWLPLGLIAVALTLLPPPRLLGQLSYVAFGVAVALLVFVVLPFVPRSVVPVINGATAWIDLGFFNFQPAEFAKVAFILAAAWYLRHRDSHRRLLGLLLPFVLMLVPVGLILKQPDLGTALVFAPALLVMLVAAGAKLRHLAALLSLGIAGIVLNVVIILYAPADMQVLAPHQQVRIKAMAAQATGDTQYLQNIGYQQDKAMTLVAAGGFTGLGERSATVVKYNKLPYDHNDMIFAVIVNRWGLMGAVAVFGLYLLLGGSMLLVAARSRDPFGRLACVGFAGIILTQAVINIGMTVGLLPITGITLPLVSYGGSSLLFTLVMVGLVLNIASQPRKPLARPSFEFENGDAIFQ
ncbi:MAG: FtsW/RodA/SpoVE family cell cycle protein [Planctomycetota bacterium]